MKKRMKGEQTKIEKRKKKFFFVFLFFTWKSNL